MRYLWLLYFPILFLPNLGLSRATPFGTIEFADLVIGPYIVLLLFAINWGGRLNVGRLTPLMGVFLAWALLSTVTISVRYGYPDAAAMNFSLLKIAKLSLYGVAGILTARALSRQEARTLFSWSLLGAALTVGISLWLTRVGPVDERITNAGIQAQAQSGTGYSAANGISVMAAILLVYLLGKLLTGHGSPLWRIATSIGLVTIVAGSAVSDGRGGWVAALAGVVYFAFRLGPTGRFLLYTGAGLVVLALLYQSQPEFKREVDVTLFPVEEYGYQGTRNVGTLDDGGRLENWSSESRKIFNAPILGSGLYNRGGVTGLRLTGSHNFWLQMLLETGIIGFALVAAIMSKMWRQAAALREHDRLADVALKGALVTALVGGMGGEYFYGGIILFALLAVYAPTGGLNAYRSAPLGDAYPQHVAAGSSTVSARPAQGY